LVALPTLMVNGASVEETLPSLTPIVMFANDPVLAEDGVPDKRPVVELKATRLVLDRERELVAIRIARGRLNAYDRLTTALVDGDPLIFGAELPPVAVPPRSQ
jgi:hypothetical protein